MKKIWIICISLIFLVACGDSNVSTQKKIIDCVGEEILLPSEINKVVCVSQNAMEFMVAMGLEDKLVGIHKSVFNHTWSCEYMNNLDEIKGFGYSPAAEAIYEIDADLVIVKDATTAQELRATGITAITFQYSNETEMFQAVTLLSDIFEGDAKNFAEKWINYYKKTVKDIKAKTDTLTDAEKKDVYFIDASMALDNGNLCTTVGGDNIVATWFEAIGVNLVTKQYKNISSISEEAILEINPETIIIGGWAENTRKEQLFSDIKWADIQAVKNNEVYLVPIGFTSYERYAVEAPLLLYYSAQQMYPNLFDYDVITNFQQFFKEFFAIDISEEKIGYILEGLSPDGTRMDQ